MLVAASFKLCVVYVSPGENELIVNAICAHAIGENAPTDDDAIFCSMHAHSGITFFVGTAFFNQRRFYRVRPRYSTAVAPCGLH